MEILREDKEWLDENVRIGTQSNWEAIHNLIEVIKTNRINIKNKILDKIKRGE